MRRQVGNHAEIQAAVKSVIAERDKRVEATVRAMTAMIRDQFLMHEAPGMVDSLMASVPGLSKRKAFQEVSIALGIPEKTLQAIYYPTRLAS